MMSAPTLVLDTSVLVAAALGREAGHRNASAFMTAVRDVHAPIVVPTLLFPELMAALRRNGYPATRIRQLVRAFRDSQVMIVPLDMPLAEQAGEIALFQAVKGSDSVFLALARSLATPLVTLDRQQRERAPADVEAFAPEQALAKWWPR
jgi:predicted nucleic acid-binding protein